MQLLAVAALEPLLASAQSERPVGTHLHVVIAGLERLVIEGVALAARLARRPDQGLVRIGEAPPAKIRHRIGFAPHHIVQNPEPQILQDRADAEDVVIGADHPERCRGLHQPPAGEQPGAGEVVIGGKARKLVPVIIDGIDARVVGPLEIALELEIVGRVGEDEIDRLGRQFRHLRDAVADQDATARQRF